MWGYAESVVRTMAYEPKDAPVSIDEHLLLSFGGQGNVAVGEIVADQLTAFHAKRMEAVAGLCCTQRQGEGHLGRIKTYCMGRALDVAPR